MSLVFCVCAGPHPYLCFCVLSFVVTHLIFSFLVFSSTLCEVLGSLIYEILLRFVFLTFQLFCFAVARHCSTFISIPLACVGCFSGAVYYEDCNFDPKKPSSTYTFVRLITTILIGRCIVLLFVLIYFLYILGGTCIMKPFGRSLEKLDDVMPYFLQRGERLEFMCCSQQQVSVKCSSLG